MGTVLLADDHELVRETIAAFLRQNGGHEVVSVGSFSEVESAIRDLTFNLILLDYRMPGMAALDGVRTLGLTAGASAPETLVSEVVDALADRFDLTVEPIETAVENVEFKVPRVLRQPA